MDVKTYCSNMRGEIESWKSQIADHMKKADRRSADMDDAPQAIRKINELTTEMEEALGRLETECPADWSAEKAQLDGILSDLERLWQEAVEGSPDDL
ncbi:MAG: hypothetical protein K9N10_09595 [Deltaproteobacteria bacterium]|nr:hypothetical protein [Deltaproteobacteria bacterium]